MGWQGGSANGSPDLSPPVFDAMVSAGSLWRAGKRRLMFGCDHGSEDNQYASSFGHIDSSTFRLIGGYAAPRAPESRGYKCGSNTNNGWEEQINALPQTVPSCCWQIPAVAHWRVYHIQDRDDERPAFRLTAGYGERDSRRGGHPGQRPTERTHNAHGNRIKHAVPINDPVGEFAELPRQRHNQPY